MVRGGLFFLEWSLPLIFFVWDVGCNVGYAFVNFIDVKDLLVFAKSKLGEKW